MNTNALISAVAFLSCTLYCTGDKIKSLLQRHQPRLVLKLGQLGVQPLQLAMPWIQFGFVTFLEADQVLYGLKIQPR